VNKVLIVLLSLLFALPVDAAGPVKRRTTGGPGFAPMQRGSVASETIVQGWGSATYALSLDGVDDYASSAVNLPAGNAIVTFMCWYYDAAPTSTLVSVLAYSSLVFGLGYPSADKAFAGNQTGLQCFDPMTRSAGWKHGAMVRPGSVSVAPQDCIFYINGELSSKVAGSFGETAGQFLAAAAVNVGRYQTGLEWYFKGKIAEIAIFNTILTQAQIQGYYLKRLTGTEPGLVRLFHCDEGSGTTCADACGSGDVLTLANGASWTTRL